MKESPKDTPMSQSNNTMQTNEPMKEEGVMVGGALMVRSKDIVDNAVQASNVTTLVAAVQAGGLVETLKGAGPFTVFAPTNDAFNKLPAGTVATLLKPENKQKLVSILTYHVVAGRYTAADLKDGMKLKTVHGQEITIHMTNGTMFVNDAKVLIPDIISSNGVTFAVDTVLMPQ
ncbi:fasciclin domain-containing protein [Patescibacteria group bacterium]|nr:fasciclin domain-containing protein [Patescibacteria group bacterium]